MKETRGDLTLIKQDSGVTGANRHLWGHRRSHHIQVRGEGHRKG